MTVLSMAGLWLLPLTGKREDSSRAQCNGADDGRGLQSVEGGYEDLERWGERPTLP